jgi:uracil-DNA glycosylase
LYRALHRAGFANQARAVDRSDGLTLVDCAITAAVHCAPPDNWPTREERTNCRPWLEATIDLLPVKVFVALGQLAWEETVREARRRSWHVGRVPKFGHAAKVRLISSQGGPSTSGWCPANFAPKTPQNEPVPGRWIVGSYHPSRQNTNTGRLTEPMLDAVFAEARRLLGEG